MGVTQQDVAGVLAYLLAAQAITATDGQVVVWHDYLTHTVPGLDAAELRPACRDAVRAWATDGRAWRIDVERFAAAVRRARSERVRAEESARGVLIPDRLGADAKAELAWRKAAIAAVGRGASRAEAEALAWRTIGRRPPAVTAGGDVLDGLTGPDRAREVLRRLKTPAGEAATAPGTGQNRPTLRRHREGSERPANRLPRNPGSERSAA
nr:MAG TPA: hypothetical protein [Caudoviricetes sp.]